jgi:hypothetical protein
MSEVTQYPRALSVYKKMRGTAWRREYPRREEGVETVVSSACPRRENRKENIVRWGVGPVMKH